MNEYIIQSECDERIICSHNTGNLQTSMVVTLIQTLGNKAAEEVHLEGCDCNLDSPEHHQGEEEQQNSESCHDIGNICPDFAVPSCWIRIRSSWKL